MSASSRLPAAILTVLAVFHPALGQNSPVSAASVNSRLTVPANTTIPLELRNAINSRTAYVGQAVYCETIYPITKDNHILVPVGTYVKGRLTEVRRPGRLKGKAELGIRFDSITLPDGFTRPLRATLSGFAGNGKEGFRRDESKVEGESSKGQDVETVAVTGAEGATIGAITRGGKGAGVSGASGALGGLIWVLATRGKEVMLAAGANLELQLTAPLDLGESEVSVPPNSPNGPAQPRRDPGPGI
jgi:hypothetical protein